jgi:PAS domain S-box-containing protein
VTTAVHHPQPQARLLAWRRLSRVLGILVLLIALSAVLSWIWLGGGRSGWYAAAIGICLFVVAIAFWLNSRLLDRLDNQACQHREWAEEAVRASEEQYQMLFNSMEEGFCTIEVIFNEDDKPVDYRFLEINPAFEKQTGLKDAKGKLMRELAPDHEQHWFDIYGKIALTGASARFENRAEALRRWYEVYAFRVGAAEDRRVGIVFSDITNRKRREEEMRNAKEQAERASHAKDEFLAALSHELRTPLTPVLLTTAVLRDDGRLPLDARDQLAMMKRNIELEARLIDDLLDLTRITHGKFALRMEPCDVHSLLALAVEMVRDEARIKHLAVEIDLRADQANVMGDPARLQQVFWNLLKNAVKFTPEAGHVTVRSQRANGKLTVEIADTGVGIPPEAIGKIFLPFEQAAEVQKDRRFGGLGLGLSISKAILDQHGAEIEVDSDGVGRGATFRVALPVTDVSVPTPAKKVWSARADIAATHDGEVAQRRLQVLLVEDHEATIEVLRRLLTQAGHHVTSAMTVAVAKQAAENARFDIVISDLGLPDGTGFQLMEELRDIYSLRGIALSGYGMDEDLKRARSSGFAVHLIKPVDFDQLRQAISEVVEEQSQAARRSI